MTSIAERNQIANLLSRNLSVLNDISLICHTDQTAGTSPSERPRITRPEEVFALLGPAMQDLPQEQLKCLLLDNKNGVMDIRTIYQGTINEIRYRPAEVLREAVIQSAASIILAHNHPSGDPTPSPEDVKTTRDIAAAGKLLSIELLDHIVIAGGPTGRSRSTTTCSDTGRGQHSPERRNTRRKPHDVRMKHGLLHHLQPGHRRD